MGPPAASYVPTVRSPIGEHSTNDYRIRGLTEGQVSDTNRLRQAIRQYIGPDVPVFQDSLVLHDGRLLWLILVPKRQGAPVAAKADWQDASGHFEIRKDAYYVRIHDEVKLCKEPTDFEQLFAGFSTEHLEAYPYEIDEPFFRLFAPHCDHFVGRGDVLATVLQRLDSRHPVVALDGLGGVGKTAIAIEAVRRMYDAGKYMFIVSLSAKSRVWHGHIASRRAGFSGLTEFLHETAKVLHLPSCDDTERLKEAVVSFLTGTPGLFLVDNLEDIKDAALLEFISLEIPDPVKVLVTSKTDRGLGALTISIPAMSKEEARELFLQELRRVKYPGLPGEEDHIEEILRTTGGVPLALKWSATLAISCGSLKDASSRLRKSDSTREEFLSFCFSAMYDELSPLARDTALLIPYLGDDWNLPIVSIGLAESEARVQGAIEELKERGIVLASSLLTEGALSILPLTADFLSSKWNENAVLRRTVSQRLAASVETSDQEGMLLNWPREVRVEMLYKRALVLAADKQFERAQQLVNLARTWSTSPRVRFLGGRIRYELGKKREGLAEMRVALEEPRHDEDVWAQRGFFAEALLKIGGQQEENEGMRLLADVIANVPSCSASVVETYCGLALELREYRSIKWVLERVGSVDVARWLVRSLQGALEDSVFVRLCGSAVVKVLRQAAEAAEVTNEERSRWEAEGRRIDTLLRGVVP